MKRRTLFSVLLSAVGLAEGIIVWVCGGSEAGTMLLPLLAYFLFVWGARFSYPLARWHNTWHTTFHTRDKEVPEPSEWAVWSSRVSCYIAAFLMLLVPILMFLF